MIYKKGVTMLTGYTKLTTYSHDNQVNYTNNKGNLLKIWPILMCLPSCAMRYSHNVPFSQEAI